MKTVIRQILKVGEVNKNGRVYTEEAVEQMIQQVNQFTNNPILGMMGYPGVYTRLEYVSHKVDELYIEDGRLMGKITILDTPHGLILQKIITDDMPDFRVAGFGDIDKDGIVSGFTLASVNAVNEGS